MGDRTVFGLPQAWPHSRGLGRAAGQSGCRLPNPSACHVHRPPPAAAGVRTGYCGSLTTFASWQLELIMLAVANNKVGGWVGGWVDACCSRGRSGVGAAPVCSSGRLVGSAGRVSWWHGRPPACPTARVCPSGASQVACT